LVVEQRSASDVADGGLRRLRSIGKYQLIARIGQGGMATVYLAVVAGPAGFNKLLVVKVLRDDLMDGSQEAVRMFWDEARLSAQLVHPNIVHTFEVGEVDGRYFLAMEYLDGQPYRTIQERAPKQNGIPLADELRILAEAARALHYSHNLKSRKDEPLGVVHRDVSPHNVFITYDGQVKVLDFGIAKMRGTEHQTQVGMIKGKLDYLAPEQLRCEPLDGRADVFALGAMLWEAITGERFAGGRAVPEHAKVHARLVGGERKIRALKPDIPEPLLQIVERAIALEPSQRFESAGAFADAIDGYLESIAQKPSAKTLAAVVEPLFEADRKRMRQRIDEQLERLESNAAQPGTLGDLPPLGGELSGSGYYTAQNETQSTVRRNLADPGADASTQHSGRSRAIIGWILVPAVVVTGLWIGSSRSGAPPQDIVPEPAAKAAPSGPGAISPPPIPEEPARSEQHTILLQVNVKPQTARVSLNGAPLVMPFQGRFPQSSSFHQIEAVADNYLPFKSIIPFDHDQTIDIVLEPIPEPAVVRRTSQRARNKGRNVESEERTVEPAPAQTPPASTKQPVVERSPPASEGPEGNRSLSGIKRRGLIEADPYAKPVK
jgi:eukaryotic-like serine/threonine-protein kinase